MLLNPRVLFNYNPPLTFRFVFWLRDLLIGSFREHAYYKIDKANVGAEKDIFICDQIFVIAVERLSDPYSGL